MSEKYSFGRLVTLNQDEYPGLGQWFVQLYDGDNIVARIYGDDREKLQKRCLTTITILDPIGPALTTGAT